jgi:uncharacterized membrane protein YecN with MAPEG domain
MSQKEKVSAVNIWTLIQVVGILVWIAGFVIAFYFVTYSKQPTNVKQNGQVAGMILTGFAYLLIVFSMIKHSPDGGK